MAKNKVLISNDPIATGNAVIGTDVSAGFNEAPLRIGATAADVGIQFAQAMDNTGAPRLFFSKTRGTLTSPTTVETGDQTGSLRFTGYVGSTGGYVQNAQLMVEADGTVSDATNGLGGRLTLWTRAPGGNVTERLRVDANGHIGIGTTDPLYKLDVSITSSDGVNGTVANSYPIALFTNRSSGGGNRGFEIGAPTGSVVSPVYIKVYATSARFAILNNANTEQFTILNGGNIGIGTTTPGYKLDVSSDIHTGNEIYLDNGRYLRFTRSSGGLSIQTLGIESGTDNVRLLTTGDLNILNGSLTNLMVVKNAGNVGIGVNNPATKLEVVGSATTGTVETASVFRIGRPLTGGVSFDQYADFKIGRYANAGGVYESFTRLDIDLRDNSTSGSGQVKVMTLTNDGNVGIGTTSPSVTFNVGHDSHGIGMAYLGASAFPSIAGLFTDSSTGQAGYGSLHVKARTDYGGYYSINFWTSTTNNTPQERMRITSAGNVGIGTTSPSSTLHVIGSINVSDKTATRNNLQVDRVISGKTASFTAASGGAKWLRIALVTGRRAYEVSISTFGGFYGPGTVTFHVMRDWSTTGFQVVTISKLFNQYVTNVRMQSNDASVDWYLEVYFNSITSSQLSDIFSYRVSCLADLPEVPSINLSNYGENAANLTYTSASIAL